MKGLIKCSGVVKDFDFIAQKNLNDLGYKYKDKTTNKLYKEKDIDFSIVGDEYFTEVKLTFSNEMVLCISGAEIIDIYPTYKGTFSVKLSSCLIPCVYEGIKRIEIFNKNE